MFFYNVVKLFSRGFSPLFVSPPSRGASSYFYFPLLFSCTFSIVDKCCEFICVHHTFVSESLFDRRTWCFDTLNSYASTDWCVVHSTSSCSFTWTWSEFAVWSCSSNCTSIVTHFSFFGTCFARSCCWTFTSHVCSFFTNGSIFQGTHSYLSTICLSDYFK